MDTKRCHESPSVMVATSQGQTSRFLYSQPSVFTFLIALYLPTVLWIRQSSRHGSTSTARCLPERAGANFVIRVLADAFVSGRHFALSQYLPAESATEIFKLLPKLSKGSSQVIAVWEMPQHSAPKASTTKHLAALSIAAISSVEICSLGIS